MYSSAKKLEGGDENVQVVDLRSDTVTQPSKEMREAMASAEVGDDVFRDDPTVLQLEKRVANLAGKEAALYVPSGTMGNLICVLAHCWERGAEILIGDRSHIHIYEQGGVAQLGGVHPRTLKNLEDGTFSIEELEAKVREDDQHLPITTLVAIENTHNKCGGRALPLEWLEQLGKTCKRLGLPLHCDGARIFNAAVSQGKTIADLLQHVDSASICLSKGLCCPVGSVIVGTKELMQKAIRVRKVLGGGMRQIGILAAAGLYALDHQVDKLADDHKHAQNIATIINTVGKERFVVNKVDSNLVIVWVDPTLTTPGAVVSQLAIGDKIQVRAMEATQTELRLAFHSNISQDMAEAANCKVAQVLAKFLEQ